MPPMVPRRAVRATVVSVFALLLAGRAGAQGASTTDARAGLKAGWKDAASAIWNLRLVSTTWKPDAMLDAKNLGNFGFLNSDLSFAGKYVFQGNFNGYQIWDASDVANLKLKTLYTCPGGQGDMSTWGNLLFMSVEETRGRHASHQGGERTARGRVGGAHARRHVGDARGAEPADLHRRLAGRGDRAAHVRDEHRHLGADVEIRQSGGPLHGGILLSS